MSSRTIFSLFGAGLILGATAVSPGCKTAPPPKSPSDERTESSAPQTALPTGAPSIIETSRPQEGASEASRFPFSNNRPSDLRQDARKKPFDLPAFYKASSVTEPTISPDGTGLLFTKMSSDLPSGRKLTEIFHADLAAGSPRQMTQSDGRSFAPAWHPLGHSFLFLTYRNDNTELWTMPVDGGESKKLLYVATGIGAARYTPDGKKIAFVSSVFPELGADEISAAALLEDIQSSPFKAHVADHLLFRHWSSYQNGRRDHVLIHDLETGATEDATPGDWDSPVFSLYSAGGYDISPTSSELCFASNRQAPNAQAWTTNADLFVAPLPKGAARNITADNPAYDGHPRYSPDGRFIGYLRQSLPGYESDRFRVALYDRQSGTTRILTEGFDDQIHDFAFTDGGKKIIFQAAVKGRYPLFEIDIETAAIRPIAAIPSTREFDVDEKGLVVFSFNSVATPTEMYALTAPGGEVKKITSYNDELIAEHDIRPVEEMWVQTKSGSRIHVFLVKPHGFDPQKSYPLVLNVHGGPQGQWADSFRGDWQVYPAEGYVVAFPNPTGSTGYGHELTKNISKDWGGKVFDEIMEVTDALAKLSYVDENRMGAMGWSYGGYMMNWIMGQTDRYAAIASMMGIFDTRSFYYSTEELWFPEWDIGGTPWENPENYAKFNPAEHVTRFDTPTLIVTGEKDYRIPYTQSLQLFTALRRRDVPARLVVLPEDGHWPDPVRSMPIYYAAHLEWFHTYLGGDPSPLSVRDLIRGRAFKNR